MQSICIFLFCHQASKGLKEYATCSFSPSQRRTAFESPNVLYQSLTVCAEPEQQGLDQQGLYVKGPKPYLCSYLANFVFICFVLSFFVFICLFLFLFVFICFCLSFICNCLLLFYLGPGFVLYVYNTSPRPQSALVRVCFLKTPFHDRSRLS